jgi:hypothetical protein
MAYTENEAIPASLGNGIFSTEARMMTMTVFCEVVLYSLVEMTEVSEVLTAFPTIALMINAV